MKSWRLCYINKQIHEGQFSDLQYVKNYEICERESDQLVYCILTWFLSVSAEILSGGETIIESGHLIIHKKRHSGEKPNRCTACEYYNYWIETAHNAKAHGWKTIHVWPVNHVCTTSSNLQQHMKKHTLEKPFEFNHCNKTFKWKQGLTRHSRTHKPSEWIDVVFNFEIHNDQNWSILQRKGPFW